MCLFVTAISDEHKIRSWIFYLLPLMLTVLYLEAFYTFKDFLSEIGVSVRVEEKWLRKTSSAKKRKKCIFLS